MAVKKWLKFLHTMGSVGFCGAATVLLLAATSLPDPADTTAFQAAREFIHYTARYILLPSMLLVIVSGLLSIAVHRPFHNAGWVWAKAVTVIWILEGTLGGIIGPAERAYNTAAILPYTERSLALFTEANRHETSVLWFMLVLSVLSIGLGIWRPNFKKLFATLRGRTLDKAGVDP